MKFTLKRHIPWRERLWFKAIHCLALIGLIIWTLYPVVRSLAGQPTTWELANIVLSTLILGGKMLLTALFTLTFSEVRQFLKDSWVELLDWLEANKAK